MEIERSVFQSSKHQLKIYKHSFIKKTCNAGLFDPIKQSYQQSAGALMPLGAAALTLMVSAVQPASLVCTPLAVALTM